ncbi:MAG: ABC transporter ATP-binding protein [Fusobacteriaceae bacterium]|nr:ABC transporter ATP-binding protein [Fusobacteriaceae bacterium]
MIKVINMISDGERGKLYKTGTIAVLEALFGGVPFIILYFLLYDIIENKLTMDNFMLYTGLIFTSGIIRVFLSYKSMTSARKEGTTMIMKLRLRLGEHIRKLSLGYFNTHDVGELSTKMLESVNKIEMIVTHLITDMAAIISLTFFVALGLFFINIKMAIATIVTVPIAYLIFVLNQKIVDKYGNALYESSTNLADGLLEFIHGIKYIKSFNNSEKKYNDLIDKMRDFKEKSINIEGNLSPILVITNIIIDFGIVILIMTGNYLLMGGELEIKSMIIFLIISSRFFENLKSVAVNSLKLKYLVVAGRKIQTIFDEEKLEGTRDIDGIKNYDIDFENVDFSYHNHKVLKNINLKIPEKTLTAFVGPSGSGKTTMTNLIARFFDTDNGDIKIGGHKIKEIDSENILKEVSMVFQKVTLFRDTIFNNIKIGKPNATKEEILEASKKANCHEFILKLPKGYDTIVGENGSTLSGGEQQRISIARAMLKDAPIILLDEATASLDPENEIFIQEAISKLLTNKTIIVIAHRLKTIKNADKIVVFENGEIKEEGTHEELLTNKSLYSRMWNVQENSNEWKIIN